MNWLLTVAILAISTAQLCAQSQQPDPTKLKADAQKVASIISGDKAKTQLPVSVMDQAVKEKNKEKFEELAKG